MLARKKKKKTRSLGMKSKPSTAALGEKGNMSAVLELVSCFLYIEQEGERYKLFQKNLHRL